MPQSLYREIQHESSQRVLGLGKRKNLVRLCKIHVCICLCLLLILEIRFNLLNHWQLSIQIMILQQGNYRPFQPLHLGPNSSLRPSYHNLRPNQFISGDLRIDVLCFTCNWTLYLSSIAEHCKYRFFGIYMTTECIPDLSHSHIWTSFLAHFRIDVFSYWILKIIPADRVFVAKFGVDHDCNKKILNMESMSRNDKKTKRMHGNRYLHLLLACFHHGGWRSENICYKWDIWK